MASGTVDPIDWQLPPARYRTVPPERHLPLPGIDPATLRIRGNQLAYAATKGKSKVFYGQDPPSGESTTTEYGVNYQLITVITEVSQRGTASCSQP